MQPGQDLTLVMLDQLVRILLMEGLKAVVWAPVLYGAIRLGTRRSAAPYRD
jgi:hypothetical protein